MEGIIKPQSDDTKSSFQAPVPSILRAIKATRADAMEAISGAVIAKQVATRPRDDAWTL